MTPTPILRLVTDEEGGKVCCTCKERKPLGAFYAQKATRDRLTAKCKECTKSKQVAYWKKTRTARLSQQKLYYKKNRAARIARGKLYYKENRESKLAWHKAFRASEKGKRYRLEFEKRHFSDPKNRMRHLAHGAINRAIKKGLPYDSALELFLKENPSTQCACCTRELDFGRYKENKCRAASPSLDRFDPAGGYTLDNVNIICMRCNQLKNDGSLEEMKVVVAHMERGVKRRRERLAGR